jgi:hypothetical protein
LPSRFGAQLKAISMYFFPHWDFSYTCILPSFLISKTSILLAVKESRSIATCKRS